MPSSHPNIVLIIGEDTGRHLSCYDPRGARTPNLDRLAAEGARFDFAFTHAPVCAPARSGLVTGRYPTSYGAHQMRSTVIDPPPMFTRYLKEAGYHVSWPTKTDFNFEMRPVEITDTAEWKEHLPREPFFVYRNIGETHESSMWADADRRKQLTSRLSAAELHDPAKVEVPPYLPDTPEVRRNIAHHYDHCTQVDKQVGDVLEQLEREGKADNTIVIFLADHGRGTPRSKRWLYDLGTHMPLIVRWPGRKGFSGGAVRNDLVGWVDIAPTLLAAAGIAAPAEFEGVSFLNEPSPRPYCFGHRGRMDEQFDSLAYVRDHRFRYIRNYRPDLPWSQRNHYQEQLASMQQWRELNAAGKLNAVQSAWFAPTKPQEELYDCVEDRWQIRNLASDPKYADKLAELRAAHEDWAARYGRYMLTPEREMVAAGIVTDRIEEYQKRVGPLPAHLQPKGGPWDVLGDPVASPSRA
jgi:N-sulfoglucosamine sulfohydrolase